MEWGKVTFQLFNRFFFDLMRPTTRHPLKFPHIHHFALRFNRNTPQFFLRYQAQKSRLLTGIPFMIMSLLVFSLSKAPIISLKT